LFASDRPGFGKSRRFVPTHDHHDGGRQAAGGVQARDGAEVAQGRVPRRGDPDTGTSHPAALPHQRRTGRSHRQHHNGRAGGRARAAFRSLTARVAGTQRAV